MSEMHIPAKSISETATGRETAVYEYGDPEIVECRLVTENIQKLKLPMADMVEVDAVVFFPASTNLTPEGLDDGNGKGFQVKIKQPWDDAPIVYEVLHVKNLGDTQNKWDQGSEKIAALKKWK